MTPAPFKRWTVTLANGEGLDVVTNNSYASDEFIGALCEAASCEASGQVITESDLRPDGDRAL